VSCLTGIVTSRGLMDSARGASARLRFVI
jgi:hypothetical protein